MNGVLSRMFLWLCAARYPWLASTPDEAPPPGPAPAAPHKRRDPWNEKVERYVWTWLLIFCSWLISFVVVRQNLHMDYLIAAGLIFCLTFIGGFYAFTKYTTGYAARGTVLMGLVAQWVTMSAYGYGPSLTVTMLLWALIFFGSIAWAVRKPEFLPGITK